MKQDETVTSSPIDALWTVNEVIVAFPDTVTVFNSFGVDSCCRGDATLEEAALESSVDQAVLISALRVAVGNAENPVDSNR